MDNCEKHKRDLFGETDMKKVAEAIGDLHYEALAELLLRLNEKLGSDAKIDEEGNRTLLSKKLWLAKGGIYTAYTNIVIASAISKPFMDNTENKKQ